MVVLQKVFYLAVSAVLVYLLFDGLRTGSVWIRGGKSGEPGESWNSHKANREESPLAYYFWLAFYLAGLVFMAVCFLRLP